MKKSFTRVLSLALVLVMLVGIMPFALADGTKEDSAPVAATVTIDEGYSAEMEVGEKQTFTAKFDKGTTDKVEAKRVWSTDAGIINAETGEFTAPATAQTVHITVTSKDAHDDKIDDDSVSITVKEKTDEKPALNITAVPCKLVLAGGGSPVNSELSISELDGYVVSNPKFFANGEEITGATFSPEKAGTYTISVTADVTKDGKTVEYTVTSATVEVYDKLHKVSFSDENATVSAGETKKLSITIVENLDPLKTVSAEKIENWDSSDKTVVTVDNGTIKGVSKGTAEISVDVVVSGAKYTPTCTVSVTQEGVVEFKSATEYGTSHVITPVLKIGDKEVPGATFDFSVKGSIATTSGTSMTLKKEKQGVVEVTVTVKSYTYNGKTGGKEIAAPFTGYISFCETKNAAATIKDGKSSFMFDETGVFSNVSVNGSAQSYPANYSLNSLWTPDADAVSYIKLKQDSTSTENANISYPGNYEYRFQPGWNEYAVANAKNLKFTSLKKGTVVLDYELYEKNLLVQQGEIKINTVDGVADLRYTTSTDKGIHFDINDFLKKWNDKDNKFTKNPEYVTFDEKPLFGTLYVNADKKTEVHPSGHRFYFGEKDNEMLLKNVFYMPEDKLTTHYEATIPYTIHGEKVGEELTGILVVEVNNQMPFVDVKPGDWFYEDVSYVYNNGIMQGVKVNQFDPNVQLSRGMIVQMLYNLEKPAKVSHAGLFKDVKSDDWFAAAVEWAAKEGIVKGYENGKFGPNDPITREQLATILFRYSTEYKKDSDYSNISLTKFPDYKSASSYAVSALEWAVYHGIMKGNDRNELSPLGGATRAEAAAMFHRFLEKK